MCKNIKLRDAFSLGTERDWVNETIECAPCRCWFGLFSNQAYMEKIINMHLSTIYIFIHIRIHWHLMTQIMSYFHLNLRQ